MGETKKCFRHPTKELTHHGYVGIADSNYMHTFGNHRDGAYRHARYLQEAVSLKPATRFLAHARASSQPSLS